MEQAAIPCVVYAAKSTEDVRGSIPAQIEECRQAIAGDDRKIIVGDYVDEAVSGYRRDRGPALAEAMEHYVRIRTLQDPDRLRVVSLR